MLHHIGPRRHCTTLRCRRSRPRLRPRRCVASRALPSRDGTHFGTPSDAQVPVVQFIEPSPRRNSPSTQPAESLIEQGYSSTAKSRVLNVTGAENAESRFICRSQCSIDSSKVLP